MTPLSDALTAAQRRALAALEKAYVGGFVGRDDLDVQLDAMGLADSVDQERLYAALEVLKTWGAPVPAEPNGAKSDPAGERISDKQRGFIEQLCREKNLPQPEDIELMSKAQAS